MKLILLLLKGIFCQCLNSNSTFSTINYTKDFIADYNVKNVVQNNGVLNLRLDKSSGGTRISSRSNLLYGTVESRFKILSVHLF